MTIPNETKSTRTNSMGWMIQRLARQLNDDMGQKLSDVELNLSQFAVMMIVLENDGLTQNEIGSYFGMPAYAISRALDGLETLGHVKRTAHPTSRRAHIITATGKGKLLAPQLFSIVGNINSELVRNLNQTEQATFKKLLAKVIRKNPT